jgi:hypothetical protein
MKLVIAIAATVALAPGPGRAQAQRLTVPAYFGIDSDWSRIQNAGATVVVVVADGSFPGLSGGALTAARNQFSGCRASGQLVLGYTNSNNGVNPSTGQGWNAQDFMAAAVNRWYAAFDGYIDGIFLDNGPGFPSAFSDAAFHSIYAGLSGAIKSAHPGATVMLNASQYPYDWVMSVADYAITFENTFSVYMNAYYGIAEGGALVPPPGWWSDPIHGGRMSHVVFNTPAANVADVVCASLSRGSPLLYIYDADANSPGYYRVPDYFEQEYPACGTIYGSCMARSCANPAVPNCCPVTTDPGFSYGCVDWSCG